MLYEKIMLERGFLFWGMKLRAKINKRKTLNKGQRTKVEDNLGKQH